MSCDATFSNPVKHTPDFCFYEPFARIEYEPLLTPAPEQASYAQEEAFEEDYIEGQISLFED